MSDWINKAVDKIHAEYPRVLAECNEHTPRPWLHAVIRDAAPRCDGCKHWNNGECTKTSCSLVDNNMALSCDGVLFTGPNFGCVMWEAK